MGEFNSDGHYIHYCGQESLGRYGVALIFKDSKIQYVCAISKAMKWPQFLPRQTIQHHSNPSLCPNYWCWRNWSWLVLWKPTASCRTNTEKDVLSIIGDWNANVGSQEIPGVTGKFGLGVQNKAGKGLTEFCQENTLVIANISSSMMLNIFNFLTIHWYDPLFC